MKNSLMKKLCIGFVIIVLLASAAILGWCMFDYYPADADAMALLENNPYIHHEDGMILLMPEESGTTGLIFYPGAKVQTEAYLPLLERLRAEGVTVALMEMPFRLAFFDPNAADRAIEALPEIKHWYISGHSLGGAFASDYATKHPDAVDGAILLAANLYGGYDSQKALLIYGSLDSIAEKLLGDAIHTVVIPGGNHAQFGNYGLQLGDASASISDTAQKDLTASAILEFIQLE